MSKKAFTMIELIFVIVVIGILAAIAIPKLAASRNDAEATVCIYEVGQLLHEISNEYTKVGYEVFQAEVASDMTSVGLISPDNNKGIKLDLSIDTTGITYVCDGEDVVTLVGSTAGNDYNLTVTVLSVSTPVAQTAAEGITKDLIGGSSTKTFQL